MRFHSPLPALLRDASGGALYVVAWALVFAILRKRSKPQSLAICAFLITCAIEFLQAWHPAWLQAIRRTLPGRLILGTTFNWWDFAAYMVGAWMALAILKLLLQTGGAKSRGRAQTRRPQRASRG